MKNSNENQESTPVQEIKKSDRFRQTLTDHKIEILGDIREIPEIHITRDAQGRVCMSFDEYRRIEEYVHWQLKKRRKVRYK